jgi:hypothetical protein
MGTNDTGADNTETRGNSPLVEVHVQSLTVNIGNTGQASGAGDLMKLFTLLGARLGVTGGAGGFVAAERADQAPRGVIDSSPKEAPADTDEAMQAEKERLAAEDATKHPELTDESVKQAVADTVTAAKETEWERDTLSGLHALVDTPQSPPKKPRKRAGFDGVITKEWLRAFGPENGFTALAGSQLYGVFGRDAFQQALTRRGLKLRMGDNDGYRPEDVVEVAKLSGEFAADPKVRTFGPGLDEFLQKVASAAAQLVSKVDKPNKPKRKFQGSVGQQRLVDVALALDLSEAAGRRVWTELDKSEALRDFCAKHEVPFPPLGVNNAYLLKDLRAVAKLLADSEDSVTGFGKKSQTYKVLTSL